MKPYIAFVFVVITLSISFVGCGEKFPYQVAGIQGTITYQGKPLPQGLFLQFVPANGEGRPSEALVGDGGKFKAVHTRRTDGIPVGKMVLRVAWNGSSDTESKTPPTEIGEILKKYGGDSPGFLVEITKSDKEFKIDLK